MNKRIDSDTAALRTRAALNAAGSATDLDQWILGIAQPAGGQHVLDLGCGTGKQVFAVAPRVLPGGSVLGVDISADAVAEVNRQAATRGPSHVSATRLSLDECVGALGGRSFDLILSTYAIYYASDLVGLLNELSRLLSPGGSMFICGYGKGTNREMIDLINGLARRAKPAKPIGDWISAGQLRQAQQELEAQVRQLGQAATDAQLATAAQRLAQRQQTLADHAAQLDRQIAQSRQDAAQARQEAAKAWRALVERSA